MANIEEAKFIVKQLDVVNKSKIILMELFTWSNSPVKIKPALN